MMLRQKILVRRFSKAASAALETTLRKYLDEVENKQLQFTEEEAAEVGLIRRT